MTKFADMFINFVVGGAILYLLIGALILKSMKTLWQLWQWTTFAGLWKSWCWYKTKISKRLEKLQRMFFEWAEKIQKGSSTI